MTERGTKHEAGTEGRRGDPSAAWAPDTEPFEAGRGRSSTTPDTLLSEPIKL